MTVDHDQIADQQVRIARLRGENVKALVAAEISFSEDDAGIVVQGDNAQGKSSLLDMIAYAFCGARSIPEDPLPEGESKGTIEVGTTGDLVVERTITEAGTYLTVRTKDGSEVDSPQTLLDRMRGTMVADPYKFRSDSARQTRETFLEVIDPDIDLEEWERNREALYEDRKSLKKKRDGLEEELAEEEPDPDLPSETIAPGDLIDRIEEAEEKKREKANLKEEAEKLEDGARQALAEVERKREKAQKLLEEAEKLEEEAEEACGEADQKRFRANRIEIQDTSEMREELDRIEEKNDRIREKAQYLEREEELSRLKKQVEALEQEVEAHWAEKREAIEQADFPVAGLTADEGQITWDSTPLEQLSQAERIYLYSALAMAENPSLRVLMIPDASLLDAEWMAKLQDLAAREDYQIFLECVHDAEGDAQIRIEGGEVK